MEHSYIKINSSTSLQLAPVGYHFECMYFLGGSYPETDPLNISLKCSETQHDSIVLCCRNQRKRDYLNAFTSYINEQVFPKTNTLEYKMTGKGRVKEKGRKNSEA